MSQGKDGREEETGMEGAERQTGEELPERWSARAKTEIVLRLLKGEELGTCRARRRCRCTSSSGGGGSFSRARRTDSSAGVRRRPSAGPTGRRGRAAR